METIECAKCGHLNPSDGHRCERCNHHLYIVCPSCGQRIPRIQRYAHRLVQGGGLCNVANRSKRPELVFGLWMLALGAVIFIAVLSWPGVHRWFEKQTAETNAEYNRRTMGGGR